MDNGENLTFRRRAMYTGLIPFLSRRELLQAMCMWEERHASGPAMALNGFISDLTNAFSGCASRRKEIQRSLIDALGKHPDELVPDPRDEIDLFLVTGELTTSGGDTGYHNAPDRAANRVFLHLLEEFLIGLGEVNPRNELQVRYYLSANLNRAGLQSGTFTEFSQWLSGLRKGIDQYYSLEVMRRLIHIVYIGACEHYGPVASDRCLRNALDEAQELPEAQKFAPRKLL